MHHIFCIISRAVYLHMFWSSGSLYHLAVLIARYVRKAQFSNCNFMIVFKFQVGFLFIMVFKLCEKIHLFGRVSKETFLNKTVFSSFLKEIVFFLLMSPSTNSKMFFMGLDNPYEFILISSFMALRRYVFSFKKERPCKYLNLCAFLCIT